MTFCGRPSQNCQRCRQRRIRCDRARPSCSQCKRANEECAGYREETSLLFRNENERIIRRSKAAHERSAAKSQAVVRRPQAPAAPPRDTKLAGLDGEVVLSRSMPVTSLDMDIPGLQFFVHHFSSKSWADEDFSPGQQHDVFRDLGIGSPFRNAVVSVGLAALSNVNRDCALLNLARQRYGMALRAVRGIITDPRRGSIAVLLKMIVMLAIFEMVDVKPGTFNSWTTHLMGIAALVKQSPHIPGQEFDVHAETWFYLSVIANYFQSGGPFPAELESWATQRTVLLAGATRPVFELVDILIRFIGLCASLQHHEKNTPEEVIREAVGLDMELEAWVGRLPAEWTFTTNESADMAGTFYGRYHVYQSAWSPRVWNHYQLGRLLVNEVIVFYVSRLREPSMNWVEQKELSLAVINQTAADICAGIATQGLFANHGTLPSDCTPRPLLKGIFMTIYPLMAAASATGVSDQLYDWVIDTLQMLGDRTGIRQALEAIRRIQEAAANNNQEQLPAGLRAILCSSTSPWSG